MSVENHIIYNITNIREALVPTTIEGVLELPLSNSPVNSVWVSFDEWKECLQFVEEFGAVKWTSHRHNSGSSGVLLSKSLKCHRSGSYASQATSRTIQKDTKKVGCTTTLRIVQFASDPEVAVFIRKGAHANHVPGERTDLRTLPIRRDAMEFIRNQLRRGGNSSNIRMHALTQIEEWSNVFNG